MMADEIEGTWLAEEDGWVCTDEGWMPNPFIKNKDRIAEEG